MAAFNAKVISSGVLFFFASMTLTPKTKLRKKPISPA
jgi:hypothetical protein